MTETATPAASAMPDSAPPSRSRRRGRTAVQAVAMIGFVVFLALAIVAFMVGSSLSGSIDRALAAGDAAFEGAVESANQATSGLRTAVGELDALITTIGETTADSPLPQAVAARVAVASERYLEIRDDYVAVRDRVQSAVARAQALDELVPFIDLPDDPAGPIAGLDDRLVAFDAALARLRTSDVATVAAAEIQAAVSNVQVAVTEVAGVAESVQHGVVTVRAEVDAAGATLQTVLWLATLAVVVLLAYVAALHLAIFWLVRR